MAPQMMAPQMPYMVQPQMMAPMSPVGFALQMAPQQMGAAADGAAHDGAADDAGRARAADAAARRLPTMAKEPKPSRWLQGVLRSSRAQLEQVAEELKPDLRNLCTHPFTTTSLQAGEPHLLQPALLEALRGHVVALMSHPQLARRAGRAWALPVPAAAELVSELRGHVAAVAGDTHGSWSVCVAFEKTHAPFMLEEIAAQLGALALPPHGGRVVQSALTAGAAAGLDLTPLVSAILAAGPTKLATHAYANYAVQLALKHGEPAQVRTLAAALLPALLQLAASKYGSNVAEALLSTADAAELRAAELVASSGGAQVVEHEYGNYVLQALIRRAAPEQRQALLDLVVRGAGVERRATTAALCSRASRPRLNAAGRGTPPPLAVESSMCAVVASSFDACIHAASNRSAQGRAPGRLGRRHTHSASERAAHHVRSQSARQGASHDVSAPSTPTIISGARLHTGRPWILAGGHRKLEVLARSQQGLQSRQGPLQRRRADRVKLVCRSLLQQKPMSVLVEVAGQERGDGLRRRSGTPGPPPCPPRLRG